jgi:hypothetical protein
MNGRAILELVKNSTRLADARKARKARAPCADPQVGIATAKAATLAVMISMSTPARSKRRPSAA